MSFASLKKSSKNNFEKLNAQLAAMSAKPQYRDDSEGEWKPTVDSAGNGYAVIRFLPPIENEDAPFVRLFTHGFQGPGGWYIENSLTTIGKEDPVGELNNELWNSTTDDKSPAREQARKQKRQLNFISNIYIIEDKGKPENNGKVFYFRYGKKIFDKLNSLMNPEFPDEQPVNPFDLWSGATFKLKIRKYEGYRNYDKSEFDTPAPLSDDDSVLEAIYAQCKSLAKFVAPENFKSYDELKAKRDKVLGREARPARTSDIERAPAQEAPAAKEKKPAWEAESSVSSDSDDEDMSFFKKIAGEDD